MSGFAVCQGGVINIIIVISRVNTESVPAVMPFMRIKNLFYFFYFFSLNLEGDIPYILRQYAVNWEGELKPNLSDIS